jgi:hypothetical protein
MQVGLEDRHGGGQAKVAHDHVFDRGLAQNFIEINIEAVLSLVEEHAAARNLIILEVS